MRWFPMLFGVCFAVILASPLPPARAGVIITGDVDPLDPNDWNSTTDGTVGVTGSGTLEINGGSGLSSRQGYLGYKSGSSGTATVTGTGSTWTNRGRLYVGYSGNGTLNIEAGGQVSDAGGYLGYYYGSTGTATVTGTGSTWTNSDSLYVGYSGNGTLTVSDGATVTYGDNISIRNGSIVRNIGGYIGNHSGSCGNAIVDGNNSMWFNSGDFTVGNTSADILEISHGGIVSVAGILTVDADGDGDSFINIDGGGRLALFCDADDSLEQFYSEISGTDAIRFWDVSLNRWAPLTTAISGIDYTLEYRTTGNLAGYTLLTVFPVPEPGTFIMLLAAATIMFAHVRRKRRKGD